MPLPPPIPQHVARGRGWWQRHWRWAMPLAVVLVVASAGATGGWTLWRWHISAHASPPMQEAMRRAGCSIDLVADFGEPLRAGWLPIGSMQTALDGRRDVALVVPLQGPQRQGQLFVQASRSDGLWDYPVVYVLGHDRQTYDLSALDDEEAAQECALRACREGGGCVAL
ncbi:cytochrome c oxidase assembly factor Coa1 family protein [Stenotrophomonas sp. 24(2023)]|uniref:cytochrome c oxidase assembly factor Coa1 family protein n=1 Tax=Stenotrophomonas sp. 24(2023) TaxID=3068324 RepID=UPI0027E14154|nr:cytochrome c oxidase assembly factor Coa1 family protein [Stenotrophomonas sp. 24(2023)]WMJ70928.1 cytochrome c oxidase assembly factor Coa1 family protein [Stenotrophomonas sp. 24(2023)]